MKVQFFSGKSIAWFQRKVVHFYHQFKAQKLKYSIMSLLFLLVCGGFYVQGLRQGYVAGYEYCSSTKSLASAGMSVVALDYIHKNEVEEAVKLMEVTLDEELLSTFWTGLHLFVPWYMPYHSRLNTEEQQKAWESALTRIAAYRKTHKSSSSWMIPGQPAFENLMTFLPSDSSEGIKIDSISQKVVRQ